MYSNISANSIRNWLSLANLIFGRPYELKVLYVGGSNEGRIQFQSWTYHLLQPAIKDSR